MFFSRDKRTWSMVGLLLMAALAVAYWAGRERAPEVRFGAAASERVEASITSNGKVEPIVPHVIRAQLAAFVQRVKATEGKPVRAGESLLQLDDGEAAAEVARLRRELVAGQEVYRTGKRGGSAVETAQLESDLRKAEAEVARLRKEHSALERLVARQAATTMEVEQAKLALDGAVDNLRVLQQKKAETRRQASLDVERGSLDVERVRTELRLAEERLRSTRVVAPAGGTLYSLPIREGQYVRVGEVLAEVADLKRVRVRAFVDEAELGLLAEGQEVDISWDAQPGRVWKGQSEVIPKAVVARGTRSVGEVICSVQNEKLELLPNTNVNVMIRVRERAQALVIPRGAVRSDGAKRIVFVLDGAAVRRREVRVGIASATKYEILEGLKEGERVALMGEVELRDGMKVRRFEQR